MTAWQLPSFEHDPRPLAVGFVFHIVLEWIRFSGRSIFVSFGHPSLDSMETRRHLG